MEEQFKLENFGKASTFASFLPGIAGVHGIPIWCMYVNRGQCVTSFGLDNKDHALMEFYPAHVAYQNVKRTGFRTFIRKAGKFHESFADESKATQMLISMNHLSIVECDEEAGLKTEVRYYTLPGEKVGALVRTVSITNLGDTAELEVLDGMPALIPYGVDMGSMKNMTQTAKAWMQVEDTETGIPYYRVRASMDDKAEISHIAGGNFSFAIEANGEKLTAVVDPALVFDYDNSLQTPVCFKEEGLDGLLAKKQITMNELPSAFFGMKRTLAKNESITIYEVIGQVESKEILHEFLSAKKDAAYFEAKAQEADELVEKLTAPMETSTSNEVFDAYCKYTYLDNMLRGGKPIQLGNNKIFYVFSRKHGDLERDYNYFSMSPEQYSQGNGNFRDVNQNRRCDTFFSPFVGRENIHTFYSLIQLDGYNPLEVSRITYQLSADHRDSLLAEVRPENREAVAKVLEGPFTPGALYKALAEGEKEFPERLFFQMIDFAKQSVNANFGEGYWSDHWTYNLDLIEDYLEIFPEMEKEMLYEEGYRYFLSQVEVNRRYKRYAKTPGGIRQYYALDESTKRNTAEKTLRADFGKGDEVVVTLLEKLIVLSACKFATLDAYGMGVEMEGGKPGWYDALNGLPGMLGSSMAESYELARMLHYLTGAMRRHPGTLQLTEEVASFLDELNLILKLEDQATTAEGEVISLWNRLGDAREQYREKTFAGISGQKTTVETQSMVEIFDKMLAVVEHGIDKACKLTPEGICPTYFTFEVPEYEETAEGIKPLKFVAKAMPLFLEGPVRYLKLPKAMEIKKDLYKKVKASDLYDNKLSMYKVNASLENASYEIGRCRSFTPGWLENESIWLHMEYKYLLELLRSGMYEEYMEDFQKAAVPFLDPKVYGRSTLENSSFIASSKNPNERIHGKGFVARLSGSTIEFISMWKLMFFGKKYFTEENGELTFRPEPCMPKYLIKDGGSVEATLLSDTKLRYEFAEVKDYIPGQYQIGKITLVDVDGAETVCPDGKVTGELAHAIRDGRIAEITVEIA